MPDRKLLILVGVVCLVEGWKVLWLSCNLVTVWGARIPSNMPHLHEPATVTSMMIEDPLDRECGIIGDVTGVTRRNMTHTVLTSDDQLVGEVYRDGVIARDTVYLGMHVFLWGTTAAKLCLGYHPYIWGLTSRITDNSVYRALCYFAFDNFIARCSHVPIQFLRVSMHDRHEFSSLQLDIVWNLILALGFSSFIYLWIQLIEKIGIIGWSFTPFAICIVELLVSNVVICTVKLKPSSHLPDDLNASLGALCTRLNYPITNVRENMTDHFPLVCYFSSVFNDIIIYSPTLLKRLSGDKVVAVVAHELGKKRYAYWMFFYFMLFVRSSALCCISIISYDNLEIDEMFGFLADLPHPTVSLYLGQAYILPIILQVIEWISNFAHRRYTYWCDRYVCSLGYSAALKNALLALAGTSNRYPVFDNSWYLTFMANVPKVQDRILEIELNEFLKSRQT